MANSITGVNDDIIAQNILDAFTTELTPLNAFATNFSDDAAKPGDTISVLRTTRPDQAAATKVTHTAYTVQDADSDAVEISLGQPLYTSYALDDVEVASSSIVNVEVWANQKGQFLAEAVLADIWDVVTNANYGAASFTGAAGGFDSDDVIDIREDCSAARWPKASRALILDETYTAALLKDGSVKDASQLGENRPIKEGAIGRLVGFDLFESTLVPANGENLVGFAASPMGLAIGMRYLQPQDGNTYFRAEPLVDPSGITLGLRDFYDNLTGRRIRVFECVFGKVAGLTAGIKRLVSA